MAIRAVPCLLGGKSYNLRLDMESMAALEDAGYDIDELVKFLMSGKLSAKRIRALLWAMTQGNDNPPSLRDVGRAVDGENLEEIIKNVGEALRLAFPQPKEDASPPPGGAGIGTPPSASPTVPSA